jgi:hypothetical protein
VAPSEDWRFSIRGSIVDGFSRFNYDRDRERTSGVGFAAGKQKPYPPAPHTDLFAIMKSWADRRGRLCCCCADRGGFRAADLRLICSASCWRSV